MLMGCMLRVHVYFSCRMLHLAYAKKLDEQQFMEKKKEEEEEKENNAIRLIRPAWLV